MSRGDVYLGVGWRVSPPSLRAGLAAQLYLAASTAYATVGLRNAEFEALVSGGPVTLTPDRLVALAPPGSALPPNIHEHAAWVLTGGDTLEPVVPVVPEEPEIPVDPGDEE